MRHQDSSGSSFVPTNKGPAFDYFKLDDAERCHQLFQILSEEGTYKSVDTTSFDRTLSRKLYEGMLFCRISDQRFMALQRQGVLGFYAEILGQEASTIGTAAAMQKQDWLIPALREHGAGLFRGMDFSNFVAQLFGNANDVTKGRQMPLHPSDKATRYINMSSCIATQIPHAVGIGMGIKIAKTNEAAVAYMGDGATSEGDFHAAMNFAGVMKVPVVFVCQNNQWAISTPGEMQCAAETLALKAQGYGMPAIRVDGNDILAVYEATKIALQHARSGKGPIFMELMTYRVSAHTSSDDPSRYRDESVTAVWKNKRDPLLRMELFLKSNHWLDSKEADNLKKTIELEIRNLVAIQKDVSMPPINSLVSDVFEESWWRLDEELEDCKEFPAVVKKH